MELMGLIWLRIGIMVFCFEHGNEHLRSVKCWKYLDWLRNCCFKYALCCTNKTSQSGSYLLSNCTIHYHVMYVHHNFLACTKSVSCPFSPPTLITSLPVHTLLHPRHPPPSPTAVCIPNFSHPPQFAIPSLSVQHATHFFPLNIL